MVKSSAVHRSSNKLVTSAESSHPVILHPVKTFELKSTNTFASRASDVFNRLNRLENDHSIWMENNETHESFESNDTDNSVHDTPGPSESGIFKKPFLPVRKNQKHGIIHKKKNTRVWRKYSLKDVPLTSDAKNAAVAFQFLKELQKKKEEKMGNETSLDDGKVTFRKPVKRNLAQSLTSLNKSSANSEIAERPEKLSKSIDSNIKLDHLQDEFEDE